VTSQLDYEVELVAVVAAPLGDAPQASGRLLGYTVGNDISARDAGKQLGSLDLFTQKALDRTAPIGRGSRHWTSSVALASHRSICACRSTASSVRTTTLGR